MEQQSKSYYNCSVDGCLNSTLNGELSFFRLPVVSERDEAIPCLCCKHCTCTTGFEKIIDLKEAGLVIYRHKVNKNTGNVIAINVTEEPQDVFILHNTKDAHISSADLLPEMEKTKTCSRCRKIMEHARKLLQNVPGINKNDALGICDHCRLRDQSCFDCKKITKKFFAVVKQIEDREKERKTELLRKIKEMLNSSFLGANADGSEIDRLIFVDPAGRKTKISVEKGGKITYPPDDDQFISFGNYGAQKMKEQKQTSEVGHPSVKDFTTHKHIGRFMKDLGRILEKPLPMQKEYTNEYDMEDIYSAGGYSTSKYYEQRKENYPEYERNERYFTGSSETGLYSRNRLKGEEGFHDEKSYRPEESHLTLFGTEAEMKQSVFSLKFPKHNEKKVRYKDQHSSSLLIKDSQDLMQKETEEDPKKIADEKQKKLLSLEDKAQQTTDEKKLSEGTEQKSEKEGKLKEGSVQSDSVKRRRGENIEEEHKVKIKNKKTERDRKEIAYEEQKKTLSLEKKAKQAIEKKKLSEGIKRPEKEGKLKEESIRSDSVRHRTDEKIEKEHKEKATKKKSEEERKGITDEKQEKLLSLEEKTEQTTEKKKLSEGKQKAETEGKLKEDSVQSDSVKHRKDEKIEKEHKGKTKQKKSEEERKGIADEKPKKPLSLEENTEQAMEKKNLPEGKKKAEKEGKLKEDSVQSDKHKVSVKHRKDEDIEKEHKEKTKKKKTGEKHKNLLSLGEKAEQATETISEGKQKPEKEKKGSETKEEKSLKKKTKAKTKQSDDKESLSYDDASPQNFLFTALMKKLEPKIRNDSVPSHTAPIRKKTKKKKIKQKPTIISESTSDSDIEIGFECRKAKSDVLPEMIKGQKILKYKPHLIEQKEGVDREMVPLLLTSNYNEYFPEVEAAELLAEPVETEPPKIEPEGKGIISYALSKRQYIEKGWTILPTEKVMRRMNVYRMRPAHSEFDWFKHNKPKGEMHYDSGERLADFTANGRGRWYYKNGRLALDYYDAEELNAQQRFVIYSNGEPDERGRPRPYTVLATFDYLGNGVVFDHSGKIRLKYNQTEGVVLDRKIGPVSNWKWHALNDPPVLELVMIDTHASHKDPKILEMDGEHDKEPRVNNEDMLAIEFDNFIKEKSKKLCQTFKPFQIKMKALKINENFSLKVLDQANVHLIYRDGKTNLKLNIGMILDHKEIVDTDTAEVGNVSNNLERFPARTKSLAGLQKSVAYAQCFERTRTERERKLHPPKPCESIEKRTAAASRPMRPLLRAGYSCSTPTATTECCDKYIRRPSSSNIYYNARLC